MSGQVLADDRPVARKEHTCELCSSTIQPGEQYCRQRIIGDDGPYVFKACGLCDQLRPVIVAWLWDPYEGYCDEDFIEWSIDHKEDAEHGEAAQAFLARLAAAQDAWIARVEAANPTTPTGGSDE